MVHDFNGFFFSQPPAPSRDEGRERDEGKGHRSRERSREREKGRERGGRDGHRDRGEKRHRERSRERSRERDYKSRKTEKDRGAERYFKPIYIFFLIFSENAPEKENVINCTISFGKGHTGKKGINVHWRILNNKCIQQTNTREIF